MTTTRNPKRYELHIKRHKTNALNWRITCRFISNIYKNMKNPQNGDFYLLAMNGETHYITVTYSKLGVARAWQGYSDICLATANGYGYDKESTALSYACVKLTGIKSLSNAAGVGVNRLKALVADAGGRLYDRQDAIGFIYDDIKANKY